MFEFITWILMKVLTGTYSRTSVRVQFVHTVHKYSKHFTSGNTVRSLFSPFSIDQRPKYYLMMFNNVSSKEKVYLRLSYKIRITWKAYSEYQRASYLKNNCSSCVYFQSFFRSLFGYFLWGLWKYRFLANKKPGDPWWDNLRMSEPDRGPPRQYYVNTDLCKYWVRK